MKQHSLNFHLFATTEAKQIEPKWKKLTPLLKEASLSVLREELPDIHKLTLNIILQSDEEERALNVRALDHDYYTDIITFEIERTEHELESEIYISIERARENAQRFHTPERNELARLAIHGLLHLAGYSDKLASAKKRMQRKERYFLKLLQRSHRIE